MAFDHLFTPISVGPLILKNRLVMAPLYTGLERNANISALRDFYESHARDGISMITVTGGLVDKTGGPFSDMRVFDEELDVTRHRLITKALHAHHCHAILQLTHAGVDAITSFPLSANRRVSEITGKRSYRAPSFALRHIIRHYARIARLAISSGYDGVEIDASGQSLIGTFLSPAINHRKDAWGLTQLSRFKLALDVVRLVRKAISADKAMGFRFNLLEFTPTGASWDEILRLVQMLRIAGVDYLCAEFNGLQEGIPTKEFRTPDGVWLPYYEALAQSTELPVIFGHNGNDMELIDEAAHRHDNALFELRNVLLADNDFVHKLASGFPELIQPCLRCFYGCHRNPMEAAKPITCIVNPLLFNLPETSLPEPRSLKKLLVVGGGLSGMYFSLFAAQCGHQVTLVEALDHLGGQLSMLAKIPGKEIFSTWLQTLEDKLLSSNVKIIKGKKVDSSFVRSFDTVDHIILATGSEPILPDVPGIDSATVITYEELLEEGLPVGDRVAVIGTDLIAIEVCRYLLETSFDKPIDLDNWRDAWGIGDIKINRAGVVGFIPKLQTPNRQLFLCEINTAVTRDLLRIPTNKLAWRWLLMCGTQVLRNVAIDMIDNYTLRVRSELDHLDATALRVDHVIVCAGATPADDLSKQLLTSGFPVLELGAVTQENGFIPACQVIEDALKLVQRVGR